MVLIDKAALLNRIAKEVHYDSEHSLEMYAKMLSLINDAPTVETVTLEDYKSMERTENKLTKAIAEVEPVRHGHWEKPQRHGVISYDEHAYAECSCCHKPQYLARGMHYCPNCGAKMDGERREDAETD